QRQLALQIREAVVALAGGRLVGGRRAADDGGDVGVFEAQAVVGPLPGRLVGEPGAVERRVEPLAGAVAGEHAPGAVGAVGGGADAQDPRRRIAEAADRARPVVLAAVALRWVGRLGLAPGDEARAAAAVVDLGGERREPLHPRVRAARAARLHMVDRRFMAPN